MQSIGLTEGRGSSSAQHWEVAKGKFRLVTKIPSPTPCNKVLTVNTTQILCLFVFSFSSSTKVDLKSGLEECAEALNLFLSNKFKDALELLRPW